MNRPFHLPFGLAFLFVLLFIGTARADSPVLTVKEIIEQNSRAFESLKSCEIKVTTRVPNAKTGETEEEYVSHWRRSGGADRITTKVVIQKEELWFDQFSDGINKKRLNYYNLKNLPSIQNRTAARAWIGRLDENALRNYQDILDLPPFGLWTRGKPYKLKNIQEKLKINAIPEEKNSKCYELIGAYQKKELKILVDHSLNFQIKKFSEKGDEDGALINYSFECSEFKGFQNGLFLPSKINLNVSFSGRKEEGPDSITTIRTFEFISVNQPIDPKVLEIQFPEWVQGWDDDKKLFFIWGKTGPIATFKDERKLNEWVANKRKEIEANKPK